MKQSKYSDTQIMSILKQAKGGVPVTELCRDPLPGRVLRSNAREGHKRVYPAGWQVNAEQSPRSAFIVNWS